MTPVKKKSKKKELSSLDAVPQTAEDSGEESKPSKPKQKDIIDVEGERTIRKSTRTAVIVRQAERDALRAALQSSIKVCRHSKLLNRDLYIRKLRLNKKEISLLHILYFILKIKYGPIVS